MKRYQAITAERGRLGLRRACQVLGVSVSGYYAWRQRRATAPAQTEPGAEVLIEPIRTIFQQSRQTYGSRRIGAVLRQQGWVCSRKRIVKIMRQEGLTVRQGRRRRPAPQPVAASARVATNHLQRDFHAAAPNSVWLADLTFIATREGWLYLALVLDLCSRRIIGWAMAAHCTSALVLQALRMALAQRQAPQLHHSDRGSQYTSQAYQQLLAAQGITASMSRTADPYDNAVMESWISTLKTECIDQVYPSRQVAQAAVFAWIEGWYNRRRLHSALGYLSPVDFEQRFFQDKLFLHS